MLRFIYTIWIWFKNFFISGINVLASVLYYIAMIAITAKGLLFGAYCVVPIIRPFVRNNRAFQFIVGKKLLDDIDEHDMRLSAVFKFFILPYAFWLAVLLLFRRVVFANIFG